MDLEIAAIHDGKSVANLGTAGDIAEIVRAIGEDRGHPVGVAGPGGRRRNPANKHKASKYGRIGATSSLPSRQVDRSPRSRFRTGTMIPQESAAVNSPVIECGIF